MTRGSEGSEASSHHHRHCRRGRCGQSRPPPRPQTLRGSCARDPGRHKQRSQTCKFLHVNLKKYNNFFNKINMYCIDISGFLHLNLQKMNESIFLIFDNKCRGGKKTDPCDVTKGTVTPPSLLLHPLTKTTCWPRPVEKCLVYVPFQNELEGQKYLCDVTKGIIPPPPRLVITLLSARCWLHPL